ncbi:hypothetical protein GGR56DRAFT_697092 [Xylariaceae sp. FL0804]|nr:hypothetical protein GGR56DRAFT_697092 [Xylariaceae sp. FL0804]
MEEPTNFPRDGNGSGSGSNGGPATGGTYFNFAYVIVPIIVVGLVLASLTCWGLRRRRVHVTSSDGDGAADGGGRDLEAGNARRGARGDANGARRSGRRAGLPGSNSREEGLNELGEAPPAYNANLKRNDEGVELAQLEHAAGLGGAPPPATAAAAAAAAAATTGTGQAVDMEQAGTSHAPPGYDETAPHQEADRAGPRESGESGSSRGGDGSTRSRDGNSTESLVAAPTTEEPAPPPRAALPAN